MKKILFIMDNLDAGGSQKVLLNVLDILKNDYKIELLLINNYGIYLKEIDEEINVKYIFPEWKQKKIEKIFKYSFFEKIKIIYYKLIFRRKIYLYYIKYKSNFLLKNKDFDYIISFQEGPSNYILANLKIRKGYKIGWIHSDVNKFNNNQKKMEKNVYKKLDLILCVSYGVKNIMLEKYPQLNEKLKVVYNPINIKIIKKMSCESIKIFDSNSINFLTIGRLSPEKGYVNLIELFKNIIEKRKEIKLYILGCGSQEKELQNKIKLLGLDENIFLLGFNKNPYKFLKNCDCYISSSVYEGLPTTIIESLILNKPIIATNIPGTKELLENKENCYLYKTKDEFEKIIEKINYKKENIEKINLDQQIFSYKNFKNEFQRLLLNLKEGECL